jgi:hypothetical protein
MSVLSEYLFSREKCLGLLAFFNNEEVLLYFIILNTCKNVKSPSLLKDMCYMHASCVLVKIY